MPVLLCGGLDRASEVMKVKPAKSDGWATLIALIIAVGIVQDLPIRWVGAAVVVTFVIQIIVKRIWRDEEHEETE